LWNRKPIDAEIPAGQDTAAINRSELEVRREEIAKLQATLGEQVVETISKNEEFGVILKRAGRIAPGRMSANWKTFAGH
jgi:hypothetical protein